METTILSSEMVDARVAPKGSLEHLSQEEIAKLLDSGQGGLYPLFRKCALAVLSSGSETDDARTIFDKYKDFDLRIMRRAWGIKLEIKNAPASAFVDGEMIRGLKDHLFAVLRDVVFISNEINESGRFDLASSPSITNAVFHILRNARVLETQLRPNLAVCWGGHSIRRVEYDYTKKVGYELGLRGLDVCTGCGPGAMKGPMKGATIGHSKQRIVNGRYLGITEPGIIAAEPPNPIVSQLVIMPDIEKRLEAFVRVGHGIVVFPGGAGTAEEILYLLGILLDPANGAIPFPVVFTGPADAEDYFRQIHDFIGEALGEAAQSRYRIVIDDPPEVARLMVQGFAQVRDYRRRQSDSYGFNWLLHIPLEFQLPFMVTHESMRALRLSHDQPVHERAANLRRAFSGIVAGNIKEYGISAIERHGPFELSGEPSIMEPLDRLLRSFVAQRRMKFSGGGIHALLPAGGMSEPLSIRYRFDLPDGSQKTLDFKFDAVSFKLVNPAPAAPPFWTELKFNQCANCPLDPASHSHCPAALQMAAALEPLKTLVSFDTVGVTVRQSERTLYVETTAQQAMSSVLGLIMATSGCPWTDRLRPMARFHLPFANEAETVYRSVSMFLLSREMTAADSRPVFSALTELYENLHVVNRDMSRRLGAATHTDPARNAMALLDSYATLLPAALERSLEEWKPLFEAWETR